MRDEAPDPASQGTISWAELLQQTTQRLAAAVDDADISARRIVEEASGWEGADLNLHLRDLATTGGVAHLDSMVARRLEGEPLQYVVGRWSFRMLDLMVDQRTLIPRPETEEVAGLAIDLARQLVAREIEPVVADLGTGTGAIGLSIASEVPSAIVHLTDLHDDALAVARANTAGLGRQAARVSIHQGSWFESLPAVLQGSINIVVANPPYVSTNDPLPPVVAEWEPLTALHSGPDGLDDLKTIVSQAMPWLAPGGALVLEMDPGQTTVVAELCRERGFVAVEVRSDLSGRERAVIALRGP